MNEEDSNKLQRISSLTNNGLPDSTKLPRMPSLNNNNNNTADSSKLQRMSSLTNALLDIVPLSTNNNFLRQPTLHEDISINTSFHTRNNSKENIANQKTENVSHRGESWYELFYDLVFVAAAIQVGTIIKSDVSLYNICQASLLFLILRLTWDNLMTYQNRFDTKDTLHYGYYLLQAMCTFVMTLNLTIDESTHEWNPSDNASAVAVAAAVARFSNWAMYLHIYYHTGHYITPGFRKYILLVIIYQFISGTLFIISSYNFAYQYVYLLLWFLCIMIEKPILNISITLLQISLNRKGRIPQHFEHMVNRQSNFILLISGESIIQLVQSSTGFEASDYLRECLGFTTIYAVGICYYQQNQICLANPKYVKDTALGYLWEGIHLPLSLSILLFAVGVKLVNTETGGYRQLSEEYIMCISASISLVLIFILRMIHKGFIFKLNENSRILSYIGRFGISILMSFIPAVTVSSTETIIFLCVLSMALVIQDTFTISKYSSPSAAVELGLVVEEPQTNSYTMERLLSGARHRSSRNSSYKEDISLSYSNQNRMTLEAIMEDSETKVNNNQYDIENQIRTQARDRGINQPLLES